MAQQAKNPSATELEFTAPDRAGLVYTDPAGLTISRRRRGKAWSYFVTATREPIRDAAEIERLNRIPLPPAYREARYCANPNGHLQAIGTDARGRRQYRYHPAFREAQDERKFASCAAFGAALPGLRRRLDQACLTLGCFQAMRTSAGF
ncbi:MAG: hypothetical protein ACKOW1_02080 [Novosphingobium sp.]